MTEDFYGKGSIPLSMQGLEELVGLELISSDARAIGTVEGVSIDVSEWYVRAIRVGLTRGTEKLIGRQTRFFMLDKVLINTVNLGRVSDAVMMKQPLAALKEQVMPEDERMMPAGAFIGMRVMCDDAVLLGHVDNILIDTSDGWRIPFIQVKLSREAKGLWEKGSDKAAPPLVNVTTGSIRAVGDMVILSLTVNQVREGSEREISDALNTGGAEGRSVH